jgi:hypothetical protein
MKAGLTERASQALLGVVGPSPVVFDSTLARLSGEEDWRRFCDLVGRFELAPFVYERCRIYDAVLPRHVLEWLESGHNLTAGRNTALIDELDSILSRFLMRGIPALVLKGPVLADLSTGLLVRPFHDLDVLVQPRDLDAVAEVLTARGYGRLRDVHQYHEVFVRPGRSAADVVEVHFDLVDRGRSFTPDVTGLWNRATRRNLAGRVVPTLHPADHLLVAMMQLPHHHWHLRLVVEIGTVVERWRDILDWDTVAERAAGWGMKALVGSTLHALQCLFGLAIPETLTTFVYPAGYFRRIQWQVVRHAVREQLEGSRLNAGRLAALVLPDRFSDAVALIARRASVRAPSSGHDEALAAGMRYLADSASNLPMLCRLLTEAAVRRYPHQRAVS